MKTELNLEQIVADQIRTSLAEVIVKKLEGYSSPLEPIISGVVSSRRPEIEAYLNKACDAALSSESLKKEINEAFNHKLARVLVSKLEGEVEKRANELRCGPEFRAKMTLAVTGAIEGLLTKGKP